MHMHTILNEFANASIDFSKYLHFCYTMRYNVIDDIEDTRTKESRENYM